MVTLECVKNELWKLREWRNKTELDIKNKDMEIESLKSEITTLQALLCKLQAESEMNKNLNSDELAVRNRILSEIKNIQEVNDLNSAVLQRTNEQIQEVLEVIDDLRKTQCDQETEAKSFYENGNLTLSTHHENLDVEIKKKNAILESVQKQFEQVSSLLSTEKESTEMLKQVVQRKQTEIETFLTDVEKFKLEFSNIVDMIETYLKARLDALDARISLLKKLLYARNASIIALTENFKGTVRDKTARIEELLASNTEKSAIITKISDLLDGKDAELKLAFENLEMSTTKVEELKDKLDRAIEEKANLTNSFMTKEETFIKDKAELNSQIHNLNLTLSEKETALNETCQKLSEKNSEICDITAALNEKTLKLDIFSALVDEKNALLTETNMKADELKRENDELKRVIDDTNVKLDESKKDLLNVECALTSLREECDAYKKKIAQFDETVKGLGAFMTTGADFNHENFIEAHKRDISELNALLMKIEEIVCAQDNENKSAQLRLREKVESDALKINQLQYELQQQKLNETNKMRKLTAEIRTLNTKLVTVSSLTDEDLKQKNIGLSYLESQLCVKLTEVDPETLSKKHKSKKVMEKENVYQASVKAKRGEACAAKVFDKLKLKSAPKRNLSKLNTETGKVKCGKDLKSNDQTASISRANSQFDCSPLIALKKVRTEEKAPPSSVRASVEETGELSSPNDWFEELGI